MRSAPAGSFLRLSSPLALWRAWQAHAQGKARRPAVAAFALECDATLLALHRALRSGRYQPDPYEQHILHEPKLRLICAPSVRDRVLHQAIVSELGPVFERSYIHDSYACRPGRGPLRAVIRHLGWMRRYRYRMHLDIARYFPSIHHDTLLGLLARKISDPATRALLAQLIHHGGSVYHTAAAQRVLGSPATAPGCGLPIGSGLSQWCANLYLDGLDQHARRTLKVRAWLRYMDDMTLFADDRDALERAREALRAWLWQARRLRLKPGCGRIEPTTQPCTFLGYRVSRAGLALGKAARRRMRGRLRAAAARGPEALERALVAYRTLVGFG